MNEWYFIASWNCFITQKWKIKILSFPYFQLEDYYQKILQILVQFTYIDASFYSKSWKIKLLVFNSYLRRSPNRFVSYFCLRYVPLGNYSYLRNSNNYSLHKIGKNSTTTEPIDTKVHSAPLHYKLHLSSEFQPYWFSSSSALSTSSVTIRLTARSWKPAKDTIFGRIHFSSISQTEFIAIP